jgi:hypothetical protein
MKPTALSALLLVGSLILGCKKEPAVQATAAADTKAATKADNGAPEQGTISAPTFSAAQPAAGAGEPAQTAGAPPAADKAVDLNREVRRWILGHRRPPKNFEEFAGSTAVQIPPPPPGKKYVLDKSMHVTLARQ